MDIPQSSAMKDVETSEVGQQYLAAGKQAALRRWEELVCEYVKTAVSSA